MADTDAPGQQVSSSASFISPNIEDQMMLPIFQDVTVMTGGQLNIQLKREITSPGVNLENTKY